MNRLRRMVGVVLLASLYSLIALAKFRAAIAEFHQFRDGAGEAHLALLLTSLSGGLFFGVLAAVTVVRQPPVHREQRIIGWILPAVVMVLFLVVGVPDPTREAIWLVLPASFLTVFGTAFTLVALRQLGTNFGVVSDVRGFVSTGLYQHVRHPLYAGEQITSLGLLLTVLGPVPVVAYIGGTVAQLLRARVEEQSVTKAFPEYGDYAKRTPMLIPSLRARP